MKNLITITAIALALNTSAQIQSNVEQVDIERLTTTINLSGKKLMSAQDQNIIAFATLLTGVFIHQKALKSDNDKMKSNAFVFYGVATGFKISAFFTKRNAYKKLKDFK